MFQVIKQTEEFEKSLKDMEFLQRDSTDLLKYARDINCHFASKKCKDVIVAARRLMTSKMHNTVKVRALGLLSFQFTSLFLLLSCLKLSSIQFLPLIDFSPHGNWNKTFYTQSCFMLRWALGDFWNCKKLQKPIERNLLILPFL